LSEKNEIRGCACATLSVLIYGHVQLRDLYKPEKLLLSRLMTM